MYSNGTEHSELLGDTSKRNPSWMTSFVMAASKLGLFVTVMLGFALVVAVTCLVSHPSASALAMLALVGAALGVAVSVQAASPGFRTRRCAIRRQAAPVLPNPMEFRDASVVGLLNRLGRARQARSRTAARSPYGRFHALSHGQSALAALERRAIVVAARAEYVSLFLADLSEPASRLDSEVARLRSAEVEAPSPEAGGAYGQAATWVTERRDVVRRLESRRTTLLATLEHLVAVLESMPAKLADLDLRRIEESDRVLGADADQAETELAQIDAPFAESTELQIPSCS